MMPFRRLALGALAFPLTLAIAACGSESTGTAELNGEPIEPIAAPAGESWNDTATVTPEGGVQVGNPEAPLKLVEYASHTCPTCARFSVDAHTALEEYIATGVVSFEIRNQVHDVLDLTFSILARCGDPSTFHPLAVQGWADLNTIIMTAQGNEAALNAAMQAQGPDRFQLVGEASGLVDWFAARGIARDQAMQCLADGAQAQKIVENSQTQSEELGVTGTPTFFLNGSKLEGSAWSAIEPKLQEAGAR